MLTRIISGVILIAVALFATLYSPVSFSIFIAITMSVALYEMMKLCEGHNVFKGIGIIYIFLGCMSLILLRKVDIIFIIFPFVVTWSCDTFAYFAGVTFGKHRLAPTISPKKSWEGAIVGVTLATIIGTLVLSGTFPILAGIILSLECAILAVAGDLVESALKRKMAVKDTSNIIPGHGGALDRIDGLIPVSIYTFIWVASISLLQ